MKSLTSGAAFKSITSSYEKISVALSNLICKRVGRRNKGAHGPKSDLEPEMDMFDADIRDWGNTNSETTDAELHR